MYPNVVLGEPSTGISSGLLSGIPPVTVYMLVTALGTLIVLGVFATVFLPQLRPRAFCRELLSTDWKYLGIAWVVSAFVAEFAYYFHADRTFTGFIYAVEGSIVAGFQSIASTPLTMAFGAVYLFVFPAMVLFTYFKLKVHDEREARRYTLAYVVLVAVSLPFFVLVPVEIPALFGRVRVEPLLFELSPVLKAGMLATDTMVKAFPSLHTGLAVLAALYARKASTRYATVAYFLAGCVVLSTFYLGIHWILDAVFAVVLVALAYWISRRVDPDQVLPVPEFDQLPTRTVALISVAMGTVILVGVFLL